MKLGEDKRQHWHAEYGTSARDWTNFDKRKLPFSRHLAGFAQIAKDAKNRGITIINACPDSEIKELPKMSVKAVLDSDPVPIIKNMKKGLKKRKSEKPGVKRVVDNDNRAKIEPSVQRDRNGRRRMHWLDQVINERKYKIGAEVGVARGWTTKHLLFYNPLLHLYAVDSWAVVSADTTGKHHITDKKMLDFKAVKKHFDEAMTPFKERLTILQGISWEMSNHIEDGSLDFVYIDADHEYPSVLKDIRAWTPKLKPNGMISGHDINLSSVKKAVSELIPRHQRSPFGLSWEARKEDVQL
jgi:predicted O-methyltransferase YrrM